MNLWECEHPGCKSKAVGVGGAIGLRAIGWFFETGPRILCPLHRPDPIPCIHDRGETACGECAANVEARSLQSLIGVAPVHGR